MGDHLSQVNNQLNAFTFCIGSGTSDRADVPTAGEMALDAVVC